MLIQASYHMSEAVFIRIYRVHCHIKFHIRRSMVMSLCLLLFGLVMQYGFDKDYEWLNGIVAILFLVSVACNYVCEYQIPKAAYRELYENENDQTIVEIQDDGIRYGKGQNVIFYSWDRYHQCYETKDAFLLYQRDLFTMVWKEACGSQIDDVRCLLAEKVNHGKPLKVKR